MFKMKGFSGFKNSPAKHKVKDDEHDHPHKEIVHADNQELSDYLSSDGTKTIRGGIKAAKTGYANQSGPKLDLGMSIKG